jgi:hypothetical protein
MLATDLSNDQKARLVQISGWDFKMEFVFPSTLGFIEINAMFGQYGKPA